MSSVSHPNSTATRIPYLLRRVIGDSMYPTLESGQLIVIRRMESYRKGEIVIFRLGSSERIKRISGVEHDFFYVLGDNPNYSYDSREYGYIPKKDIIGKVIFPHTL